MTDDVLAALTGEFVVGMRVRFREANLAPAHLVRDLCGVVVPRPSNGYPEDMGFVYVQWDYAAGLGRPLAYRPHVLLAIAAVEEGEGG